MSAGILSLLRGGELPVGTASPGSRPRTSVADPEGPATARRCTSNRPGRGSTVPVRRMREVVHRLAVRGASTTAVSRDGDRLGAVRLRRREGEPRGGPCIDRGRRSRTRVGHRSALGRAGRLGFCGDGWDPTRRNRRARRHAAVCGGPRRAGARGTRSARRGAGGPCLRRRARRWLARDIVSVSAGRALPTHERRCQEIMGGPRLPRAGPDSPSRLRRKALSNGIPLSP